MKKTFNKNIATVSSLTGISRVLGLIRDVVIAWLIGAGPLADAFFVAFRIPNMLRRLSAEGASNVAFVPVFNETLEKEGLARAMAMARSVITLMLLVLGAIVVIGEFIAPLIVGIIAPGFLHTPTFDMALHLTRIMFPYILLVSILALIAGVLNSLGHFAAPAAAPIVLNIFMIATPIIFYKYIPFLKSPADAIAWGVITGGLFQIALQIHPLKRLKVSIRLSFRFKDPRIIQIAKLMGMAALVASVYQINVLVGTLLASFLPRGSVSFLYYANRLIELPLGIFAFAVGNVMLPAMSQASAKMNISEMSSLTGKSVNAVLLFTIPASIGIFVLADPIITLLFVRGNFSYQDALSTAQALRMYAIGLWAIGISRILTQAFYAMQQATTAVRVAWATLGLNVVFCLILMPSMKHSGIALASTISIIIQSIILLIMLSKKGVTISSIYYRHCTKMVISGALMALCIYPLLRTRFWVHGLNTHSLLMLGASIGIGAASYFALLWITGIRQIKD